MDRREPSRVLPPSSDPEAAPSARLRAFERLSASPTARKLATPRIIVAIVAALVVLGVLWVGGRKTGRSVLAWLHQQPAHRRPFREIELSPPPPPWIRIGAQGLLEQVRHRAGLAEEVDVLEEDLAALRQAFGRECAWIRRVDRVERAYPNRLVVHLVYRKPVAEVVISPSDVKLLIDREGVVLPRDEFDGRSFGPLYQIALARCHPSEMRAGRKFALEGSEDGSRRDHSILAALALADFLSEKGAFRGDSLHVPVQAIHVNPSKLWVQAAGSQMFFWGNIAPKAEDNAADLEAKWAELRDKIRRKGPTGP